MHHSHSNLTSLAALVENAEARRTAIPPPAPRFDDASSGMIDLQAMEQRAREERERAATPIPVVATIPPVALSRAPGLASDHDFYAAAAGGERRKRQILFGTVGAAAALVLAVGLGSVFSARGPASSAAAAPRVEQPAPPPVAPAPPPVAPAPPPIAAAPSAAADEAPAPAKAVKGKKKPRKHGGAKGPKLVKVQSGGT